VQKRSYGPAAPHKHVKPSITFLYPSRNIGGAQLLFARMAEEISAKELGHVSIIDYKDGFIRTYLKNCHTVRFIEYREEKTVVGDTTVVVPLSHLVDLPHMLAPVYLDCRFLFWSIHPDNIKHVLYSMGRKYLPKKTRAHSLLKNLTNQGHIVFMDEANERACEKEIGNFSHTSFLQIPIKIASGHEPRPRRVVDEISIAWLGRITYDKINSIKKIIKDIEAIQCDAKVKFHIIGSGPEDSELQAFAAVQNVALYRTGVLQGPELRNYLIDKVDIGIAMGTSCLEIGALSIPIALIDYSLSELPEDANYDWLYDTKNFTLGNDAAWGITRGKSLIDLIESVKSDPINSIGAKCFEYVHRNHALDNVAEKLTTHISQQKNFDRNEFIEFESILNPFLHRVFFKISRKIKRTINKNLGRIAQAKLT